MMRIANLHYVFKIVDECFCHDIVNFFYKPVFSIILSFALLDLGFSFISCSPAVMGFLLIRNSIGYLPFLPFAFCFKKFLDYPVLEAVERDDCQPAPGPLARPMLFPSLLQCVKLVIDCDPQSLESLRRRMDPAVSVDCRNACLHDLRQLAEWSR